MASIYLRGTTYWLRYYDPEKAAWCAKATPLKHPKDARKAKQLKLLTSAGEEAHKGTRPKAAHTWGSWVPSYLQSRYGQSPKTLARYTNSWTHLEGFLEHHHLTAPATWTTQHNASYVDWKASLGRSRNVAIWDLGVMAMLMNEAKRRGFILDNKVSKARIPREKVPQKPDLTNAQIADIRKALVKRPDLANAFEIALHTGCRISETVIDFQHINFERGKLGTITFNSPKGGVETAFSVPILFPAFRKWLLALRDARLKAGHSTTCTLNQVASRDFGRLCDKIGHKDITYHCLRVTFVTRAFEAGLSGEVVRKLVRHSDVLVNRLYQRFSIEGLQELGSQLSLPVVKVSRARNAP